MTLVRPRLTFVFMAGAAVTALAASTSAWSLGFGEVRAQALLGQPLNVAVPVTLGEGESLGSECAMAEVTAGDVRLQPSTVKVRVTQGRDAGESVIRIATTVPVDEPVLLIQVGVGCPVRMIRTLTVLADPPLVVPVVSAVPAEPAATSEPHSAAAMPPVPAVAAAPATEGPRRATRPATPTRASRASVVRPAAREATASASSAGAATPPPRRMAVVRTETSRSRLQLDSALLSSAAQAASAAEAQASALRATAAAAEAAASESQQRLRAMEADLARVRAEAKAQSDAMLQLKQQIAQDQSQRDRQSSVVPYLMAAVGVMALLAVWLGWRLRHQHSQPQRDAWWDRPPSEMGAASAGEDSRFRVSEAPPPPRISEMGSLPGTMAAPIVTEHGSLDSIIAPPTVPAPVSVTIPPIKQREEESTRAMTVDEQIDLEQQADFFIALGHDEAAIDLLLAHLRSTGGGTPLPFLKLLEIHRRRGDREAYERTRVRFNQRFNSVAPDWMSDPKSGRTLEDYPLTIARLQRAWATPLDAMAELESLLFRRGTGAELFELPAYQEVLFLYQLARDLHQANQIARPETAVSAVDVLLPIGSESDVASENRIPLRPEFDAGDSLDLDLTLPPPLAPGEEPPVEKIRLELEGEPPPPVKDDVWGEAPR